MVITCTATPTPLWSNTAAGLGAPAHLHVDAAGETVLLHQPFVPPGHQAVQRVGLCPAQKLSGTLLRQLQG